MAPRRNTQDDDLSDTEEDDGTEEVESEEAEGDQLPPGRKRRKGTGRAASQDIAADEDDTEADDEEAVNDPIARAVARAEARMRHQYIKPLKAELARLKQDSGNAGAVVETVRSLQLENHFLRLAGGTFYDSEAAFKLADTSQVQISDAGKVTGMDAVIDQLMQSHPYLVRDDDDTTTEEENYFGAEGASGRPMNSQRGSSAAGKGSNDAALYKRYPALQRRRGW